MTFTEAVNLARKGDKSGYAYLYEQTYKKSLYVARKYTKDNKTETEDIVQDSYILAFKYLDKLNDPEKFPNWFSRIVASTALKELKKKTPTLFSQMDNEDTDIKFEDTIENKNVNFQPEESIDGKETQRLVKEILDTLSDEQRMCVMMYYYEDIPVKDAAETLGVSENTVKSRLNYGRKAIKEKVLELEKRGIKLYGILPIGFFIYLLKQDAAAATPLAGLAGISGIIGSASASAADSIKTGATHAAKKAASSAAKAALRVKVTIGAVAAAVAVTTGVTVAVKHNPVDTETHCASIIFHEKVSKDKYECYYEDNWTDPDETVLKKKTFKVPDDAAFEILSSTGTHLGDSGLFSLDGEDFNELDFKSGDTYKQYTTADMDKGFWGVGDIQGNEIVTFSEALRCVRDIKGYNEDLP